jgi:hypothetical protein
MNAAQLRTFRRLPGGLGGSASASGRVVFGSRDGVSVTVVIMKNSISHTVPIFLIGRISASEHPSCFSMFDTGPSDTVLRPPPVRAPG